MPIIVISAKTSLDDKVNLLELGSGDYITNPFELEEIFGNINENSNNKEHKFKELILNEQFRALKDLIQNAIK